ncbi:MAG: DUF1294 domain-containing protein [Alphaproteobacteria bacterium]|nr:DUF1294 domain-containing protein [Alphaproteobacteria bacterium]
MLLTFLIILTPLLVLVRPLQRNRFFVLYFAAMILSAYITENHFFKTAIFSHKAFLCFIVYHLCLINITAFIAYGVDKRAAVKGIWRIPETDLHTLEFLGGWIGAFLGQKIFHHKNKKKSYQAMFWLMLVLQSVAIYIILSYLRLIK